MSQYRYTYHPHKTLPLIRVTRNDGLVKYITPKKLMGLRRLNSTPDLIWSVCVTEEMINNMLKTVKDNGKTVTFEVDGKKYESRKRRR